MHGDKDTYRLAFALANKASKYNQVKIGPQLGLTPWKRPEGLFYVSAGFVQPDFDNATAFYHRVEHGAKFNPASPLTLNPLFVTTTLSHSWRRPGGTSWFDLEYGGGGLATHYPAASVNVTAYQHCCSSPSASYGPTSLSVLNYASSLSSSSSMSNSRRSSSPLKSSRSSSAPSDKAYSSLISQGHSSSCSCQPTSSSNDNQMLAIPVSYFPQLKKIISISQKIFSAYQHDLWRQEHFTQS